MTEQGFDTIVSERLEKTKIILIEKGKHYRRNQNPFHNFDVGASITNQTREKVLYGFLLKHLISFQDMINDIEEKKLPTIETVEEKIGDIVNYCILFEASIKDKINDKMLDMEKHVSFTNKLFDVTNPLLKSIKEVDNDSIKKQNDKIC